MVNRIADRILSAVLPHKRAAAPCGPVYYQFCYCSRGLQYRRRCQDCTGAGGGCGSCTVITGSC
jgi:hypothetical protein